MRLTSLCFFFLIASCQEKEEHVPKTLSFSYGELLYHVDNGVWITVSEDKGLLVFHQDFVGRDPVTSTTYNFNYKAVNNNLYWLELEGLAWIADQEYWFSFIPYDYAGACFNSTLYSLLFTNQTLKYQFEGFPTFGCK